MSDHVDARRLDALAAGDTDVEAATHVDGCEACLKYVEALRSASEHFQADPTNAEAFAHSLEGEGKGAVRRSSTRPAILRIARFSPLLAVAAAVVLWIGITNAPSRSSPRGLPATDSHEIRLKGALALAVVRERDGQQERFTESVLVRAFDRLRAEVQVASAGSLAVAFIGDDGSFIELMSSQQVDPGEHYAATAIHMDEHPTAGRIVAGTPAVVERARREGRFEGVTTLEVEVEH